MPNFPNPATKTAWPRHLLPLGLGATTAMTGNVTLTGASPQFLSYTPDAARNLVLPAEELGPWLYFVTNQDATYAITVKNDADGTVTTIDALQSAVLWCPSAGGTWVAGLVPLSLAAAAQIGITDSGSYITATNVETALAELATRVRTQLVTCTLAAAAENSDDIVVTVNAVDLNGTAVSRVQRFKATVYQPTMIPASASEFTIAETGAGAEISTTAQASLLFSTDASGDAALTVHDVAGGSNQTVILELVPVGVSGTYTHGTPVYAILTFDGS